MTQDKNKDQQKLDKRAEALRANLTRRKAAKKASEAKKEPKEQ